MSGHGSFEPDGASERDSVKQIGTDGIDDPNNNGAGPRTATVPIDSLVPGETPRLNGVSPEHVHILSKVGAPLPPLLVERSTMRIIDGMHRLQAAMANGQRTIEVEFFDGPPRAVFVQAVKANIAHGLPLSLAERRAAAERIIELYPEWSDRMVADSAGLSDKTVAAVRRSLTANAPCPARRIGRDGRVRPLNSTVGRWIASELIEDRPHASLREIAREAGISVATVRDVRERMRRGDGPIPAMVGAGDSARRDQGEAAPDGPAVNPPGGGTSRVRVELDGGSLLEGLKKDPSLRYNEMGRELLRWLDLRTVRTTELGGVAERVPPHAAVIVAKVARQCAAVWESLAKELEWRSHDPSKAR